VKPLPVVPLGSLATVVDCEHKTAPRSEVPRAYGFSIGTGSIRKGRIDLALAKPVDRETHTEWARRMTPRPGDLILAREAPIGEPALVPEGIPVCLGQRTVLIRPDEKRLDVKYLLHWLMSPCTRSWMLSRATGSTVLHLNVADVRRIPVHLVTLDEQRRIVEILEGHLSRLDVAATALSEADRKLRTVQAARLHGWLLSAVGDTATLGELAVDAGYGTSAKCVVGGPGPTVVRIPNLNHGRVDLVDEKRIADGSIDVSGLMLAPRDLLIVRTNGSRELIGRTAVVQEGVKAAFASYLIRFRLDEERIVPEWVHLVLQAPSLRAKIESLAASSAGQYNLGLKKLESLELPVPTIEDQRAVVAEAAAFTSDLARFGDALKAQRRRSDALRRALLTAAFSGRLTGVRDVSEAAEEMAGV
jgi:type I restriction enzyme S subunit